MYKLDLVPVKALLENNFFIPSYQRGYRWKERQVIDLLEDILEFHNKGNEREDGEYYCLQPLVVKQLGEKNYEVIDGQQRVTTLFLILKYFKILLKEEYGIKKTYSIEYQTRQKSWEFLEKIQSIDKISKENPDYYHISKAYQTIAEWFDEKIKNNIDSKYNFTKRQYLETLIFTNTITKNDKKIDIAKNVRFIWYEIKTQNEEDAKNIFTRINMDKIPLRNAELIKALFFINGNQTDSEKEKYQNKIAYEWNNIENALQNKTFWFFINKSNSTNPTKIEFIFDLIANKYKDKVSIKINKSIDKHYTFYVFSNLINNEIEIEIENKKEIITKDYLWKEIKTYFRTFDEWYNNNEYYHLIGYLIHMGKDIEEIKNLSNGISKSTFKNELIELIKKQIKSKFEKNHISSLDDLSYQDDKEKEIICDILLLFNVITTMESKYTRFPFERYINEKWSLEHIHAQNSENLENNKQKVLLLEEQRIYFKNLNEVEILNKINVLLEEDNIDNEEFANLQLDIFNKYTDIDIDSEDMHSINNLALLSRDDNSALNNKIFPVKRDKIISLDKKGSFIPICTKNVFLKLYSNDVMQNAKWTKKDKDAYLKEIKSKLDQFLPKEERKNEN